MDAFIHGDTKMKPHEGSLIKKKQSIGATLFLRVFILLEIGICGMACTPSRQILALVGRVNPLKGKSIYPKEEWCQILLKIKASIWSGDVLDRPLVRFLRNLDKYAELSTGDAIQSSSAIFAALCVSASPRG